ncbi:hypothetical protein QMK19_25900 [Streptomyces sp. H10-C2]|uniref:hypothetical protein n=1 Tax=unclassified Streptomyces TaxID=2593676 RepID=UPI0024BA4403|nr:MULTISPECIES: hypothetical protein [unclassified Streptomyces]MDJ0345631.1 hypothetical protein [Streptomyces sp. PH10-H1]MDJ0372996.1 hypothetical protein [Streptomyces sp. H10-C2]
MTSAEEFTARWRNPPNFSVAANLVPFHLTFPDAREVLDIVRRDEEARITVLGDISSAVRTARSLTVRTAPLDEILSWPFRLAHFNLSRFYGGLLHDFQAQVMIPWRAFLAGQGFTWQRCSPALFISGPGSNSTYHSDNSHGLVWQVEGIKTFHSYQRPDEIVTAGTAVSGEITAEQPPAHDPAARQSMRMEPGNLLWSHALTPHWVTGESPLSMSVTLSLGGLCHQGRYAAREIALRRHWDEHPEQAWLTDLRNTRY